MDRLIKHLRDALVEVLSVGTWKEIECDHERVDLNWREDLEPGCGKPRYVERVLRELDDGEVLSLSQRALKVFGDRYLIGLEDAVWWIEARGESALSSITRRNIAALLDGRRLHPEQDAEDFVAEFAIREPSGARFLYGAGHQLFAEEVDIFAMYHGRPDPRRLTSHWKLLEVYGVSRWPDKRVGMFLERLVHPEVRVDEEQKKLVDAINEILRTDGWRLDEVERLSGHPVFKARPIQRGVDGRPKNLIFASKGPKPELGFSDAVNNDIIILSNAEHCLIYDEPITGDGLLWADLWTWWAKSGGVGLSDQDTRRQLGDRLLAATGSPVEELFFKAYFRRFSVQLGERLPALIPQVYLHHDPVTVRQLRSRGEDKRFPVQRMDFLMLLPDRVRVVLEVDGQQHYAEGMHKGAVPSPRVYADTVSADRSLRLAGYEVYRFGGYELRDEGVAAQTVEAFFCELFTRHRINMR